MDHPSTTHTYNVRRRFGRAQGADIDDPYRQSEKSSGLAICPDCRAVYQDGRWQWKNTPAQAEAITCQACRRIRDNYPAGELHLSGAFASAHRTELIALARHHEAEENKDHPLNRIITIGDEDGTIVITTTDIHLPRRIGRAIRRAYDGKLDIRYDPHAYFVRAKWQRD